MGWVQGYFVHWAKNSYELRSPNRVRNLEVWEIWKLKGFKAANQIREGRGLPTVHPRF